jgi:hypothetical protein
MLFVVIRKPKPKYLGMYRHVFAIVEATTKTDAVRKCNLDFKDLDYSKAVAEPLEIGKQYWL